MIESGSHRENQGNTRVPLESMSSVTGGGVLPVSGEITHPGGETIDDSQAETGTAREEQAGADYERIRLVRDLRIAEGKIVLDQAEIYRPKST